MKNFVSSMASQISTNDAVELTKDTNSTSRTILASTSRASLVSIRSGGARSRYTQKHGKDGKRRQSSYHKIIEVPQGRFNRRLSILREASDEEVTSVQPVPSTDDLDSDATFNAYDGKIEDDYFPYENLVLEGGGTQGNAYIGAIMELERLGLLRKIKRFAGSSVGSVTAAYLAVGHGSDRLIKFVTEGPQFSDLLDAPLGMCSLLPNFLNYFGWHPGRKPYDWFASVIAEKLGNPHATFKDLYDKTGKELCIVVTNLSLMMEEYCHVKTTPDLPIAAAIRMSVAAPGVFYPFKREHMGKTSYYIDGGVVCNYAIHCFDGWWLSMKPEDSFLKRMQPLKDVAKLLTRKERFGTFNEKTFGMIIYSDYDSHVLATNPHLETVPAPIPNTKLARAYQRIKRERELTLREHRLLTEAMNHFLRLLNENNLDGNDTIDLEEFKRAITDYNDIKPEHVSALFGTDMTTEEIFKSLDANNDGQLDFHELMSLAEQEGVGIQTHHIGSGRLDINNASDFFVGIIQLLLMNVKRAFIEGCDIERTVLINTVYIKSMEFDTKREDLDFLVEQGRRGIRAFLKYQRN